MTELLQAGLNITLIGMTVVFVLLVLLVGVVNGMSRLARAIEGAPAPSMAAGAPAVEEEIVSAIGAAVAAYRQKRKY